MGREFNVVVERDAEGYYVASVPTLQGCHTQARSLDELMDRGDRRCAIRGVDLMILAAGVRRIEPRLTGHKS